MHSEAAESRCDSDKHEAKQLAGLSSQQLTPRQRHTAPREREEQRADDPFEPDEDDYSRGNHPNATVHSCNATSTFRSASHLLSSSSSCSSSGQGNCNGSSHFLSPFPHSSHSSTTEPVRGGDQSEERLRLQHSYEAERRDLMASIIRALTERDEEQERSAEE